MLGVSWEKSPGRSATHFRNRCRRLRRKEGKGQHEEGGESGTGLTIWDVRIHPLIHSERFEARRVSFEPGLRKRREERDSPDLNEASDGSRDDLNFEHDSRRSEGTR